MIVCELSGGYGGQYIYMAATVADKESIMIRDVSSSQAPRPDDGTASSGGMLKLNARSQWAGRATMDTHPCPPPCNIFGQGAADSRSPAKTLEQISTATLTKTSLLQPAEPQTADPGRCVPSHRLRVIAIAGHV